MKYTKKSNKKKGNFKNINDFSCFLINNNNIKNFAFDIFYKLLIFWKNNYPTKWKSIISPLIKEKKEKNIISLIGFNSSEIITIFKYLKDKSKLFEFFNDKFLKVTSSINNLCNPILTIYIVNKNKYLQEKFITNLNKSLLTKKFTWDNFYKSYTKITNKNLKYNYNFFVFDIIFVIDKDDKNYSIYRKNLINMDFFRTKKNNNKIDSKKYLKNLNKCTKSIIGNNTYKKYGIYTSKKKYKISFNSPYAKIMQFYNKKYIGGPSGSASLLYIMLFEFYNIMDSKKNNIMLLGLIIADYIPLWHTINEILLTSYPEMKNKNIKKYTLKKNALNYSYNLLKPYL
jgi:hypothetical protein